MTIYNTDPRMLRWNICYQTITPKSAEQGDFADQGFVSEGNTGTIEDLLSDIEYYGPVATSNSDGTSWLHSVYPERDFRTGGLTNYSIHISGVTDSTLQRIYKLAEVL